MKIIKAGCIVLCALTLAACGSQDASQKSMEYKLSYIDGKPSDEAQYKALLDNLDSRCQEDRNQVGDMAVWTVQELQKVGRKSNNREILQAVQTASESADPSSQIKCAELYAVIVTMAQQK